MNKHIAHYDAEDFVLEDTFRSWVLEANSPHTVFWETYHSQHPAQHNAIVEAKNLILVLDSLQQETPDEKTVDTMWQRIQAEIFAESQSEKKHLYSSCLA